MKHQLNTNSNNDPPNPPAAAYTAILYPSPCITAGQVYGLHNILINLKPVNTQGDKLSGNRCINY